ncbi:MAG TPA: NAD(P)H-dependent glycerol-3-phosphate dehydrogenase [Bryobacteraceae bacterium]|jgi:glycerol-3-phosphate dehydrogenase (NAD(P)+)
MRQLAIIGSGSWGTALAMVLAPRFEQVKLWAHESDLVAEMRATRINSIYLPGFLLASNIEPTDSLEDALVGTDVVLGVMPTTHARRVYTAMKPYIRGNMRLVSSTKGIEQGSLKRVSQIIEDVLDRPPVAVLSGPTFAREVAAGEPAAIVISSTNRFLQAEIQKVFSCPTLRLYTNDDPIGVEVGGALKNVIAVAAGVVQGLKLGNNTMAALITRGLAEITRLAVAMGANPQTLSGLAGMGDLVLTCTGDLSRNRSVGIQLAAGKTLDEITGAMKMVAEGVNSTISAMDLARKHSVNMPITEQVYAILKQGKNPGQAIRDLMERSLKPE